MLAALIAAQTKLNERAELAREDAAREGRAANMVEYALLCVVALILFAVIAEPLRDIVVDIIKRIRGAEEGVPSP